MAPKNIIDNRNKGYFKEKITPQVDRYSIDVEKSIAVVGNASSLFDKKNGRSINRHDVVIRFNGGIIVDPESQGTKTTIIAFSYFRRGLKYFRNAIPWPTLKFVEEREYLYEILGARPSNGAIVLERLRNRNPNNKISLFGFDWNQTTTWYKPIEENRILLDTLKNRDAHNNRKLESFDEAQALDWFSAGSSSHDFEREREYFSQVIQDYHWTCF